MARPDFTPAHVLVVGEALVDVVDGVAHPGGSPLNVAVGLQRLGVPATLHSDVGADPHGVLIADHLAASSVAVTRTTVRDRPTSVAQATLDASGAATYAFSIDWDPAPLEVPLASVDAVHTGSIAAVLEPGATTVERLLAGLREHATISYDPNVRPQLMGSPDEARPRVERLIALADVVKASDEDIAWLYPDAELAEVLERWLAFGPALVVATRGGAGADGLVARGPVHVPAPAAVVADTIGAGDSFMAGLLRSLSDLKVLGGDRREALHALHRRDAAHVLRFAVRCAAITVSRPGADPPTAGEVATSYV